MSRKTVAAATAGALAMTMVMGAVLHAESPSFTAGETLSASKMNASFASLTNRIDQLEKANAVPAVPSGTIAAFGGSNVPDGWLACDGSALDRVAEPTLFTAIGTSWGAPDETKFNLPDLRGRFLRGLDGTAERDPDRDLRRANADGGNAGNLVGSVEGEQLRAHTHDSAYFATFPIGYAGGDNGGNLISVGINAPTTPAGGNETRPKNANVIYVIKR